YDTERLQIAAPLALQALVEEGPELMRAMLSPEQLARRMDAGVRGGQDATWASQLRELAEPEGAQQIAPLVSTNVLFEQYARVLQRVAAQRPLLLLLDDLQWVDEGSANLLLHLGKRLGDARLLLVGAYRPGDVGRRNEDGRQALQ